MSRIIKTIGTNLVKVASSTIEACDNGSYTTTNGSIINIEDDLDDAIINTVYVSPNDDLRFDIDQSIALAVELSNDTTAVAGRKLAAQNPVILNFASARNPGGGFLHGARAQEEDLCRVSGLYSCLIKEDLPYYQINKDNASTYYTDGIVYSPQVPFFKDENYNWLEEPFKLSVVTCPAPNVSSGNFKTDEVIEIFERRIDRVLSVMACYEHKNIVLGAWGCGAFGNDPIMVAQCFKNVLKNKKFGFEKVIFAIPEKHSFNYLMFEEVFEINI